MYGYAAILIGLQIFNSFITSNLGVWQDIIGIKLQASLKSLLYRKALKLSLTGPGAHLGNIITLITKDIVVIVSKMWIVRDLLQFLFDLGTTAILLYGQMGSRGFIGMAFMFVTVPIQGKYVLINCGNRSKIICVL